MVYEMMYLNILREEYVELSDLYAAIWYRENNSKVERRCVNDSINVFLFYFRMFEDQFLNMARSLNIRLRTVFIVL